MLPDLLVSEVPPWYIYYRDAQGVGGVSWHERGTLLQISVCKAVKHECNKHLGLLGCYHTFTPFF